jgi:hypothetical protein
LADGHGIGIKMNLGAARDGFARGVFDFGFWKRGDQERVKKLIFEAKTVECSGKAARSAAIVSPVFIPF